MYLSRYKLKATPFGSVPDADFFFLCDRHAEARQRIDQVLWYDEPFVAILGQEGIGKTILLRHLLEDVHGDVPLIHLEGTLKTPLELLRTLLSVLGFDDIEAEREQYRNILSAYLTHQQRQGSRPVLVLDQAENLPIPVLEEIRWLATIGDEQRPALHFLLFGREEFAESLLSINVRDLGDQIRIRYSMRGLSEGETLAYINHRLALVGGENRGLIPDELIPVIYRYTNGVPARINSLCHAGLARAAEKELRAVDAGVVSAVIDELELRPMALHEVDPAHKSLGAFKRDDLGKFVITHEGRLCGAVRLDKDRIVIGRHSLNNICIDSSAVSRCHAQVVTTDGAFVLMDLNSTNGTFVNFKRIQQHILCDNDIVAIGRHRLKFVAGRAELGRTMHDDMIPSASQTVVLDGRQLKTTRPAMKRVK